MSASAVADPYLSLYAAYKRRDPKLADGLVLFSVPHWISDELATALARAVLGSNGDAASLIADVRSTPLVRPYEGRGWRIADPARSVLLRETTNRGDLIRGADQFLSAWFADGEGHAIGTPLGRETRWRFAYHVAPADPVAAVTALTTTLEASARPELADFDAALRLFSERRPYLAAFATEEEFFRGLWRYRRGEYREAERTFRRVWEARAVAAPRVPPIAGHLLGRLVGHSKRKTKLNDAILILEEAYNLADEIRDDQGIVHIGSTLGTMLVRRGKADDLAEAARLLRISLRLAHTNRERAIVLNNLGRALTRLGSDHWFEAAEHLETALTIGETSDDPEIRGQLHISLSELAELQGDLPRAIQEMELALDIHRRTTPSRVALDEARLHKLRHRTK